MKSKFWLALEIIAGIILIALLVQFAKRKIEDKNYLIQQEMLKGSIQSVETTSIKDVSAPVANRLEERNNMAVQEVEKLRNEHPSIIAVIQIPGTNVLYPIVQGEDNQFYLDHDKDGHYHPFGEVFLDSRNTPDFKDTNSIIYGHNIRSAKTIFNELLQYEDQEYFDAHRAIYLYTQNGFREYKVVSVFKANPDESYREIDFDEGGYKNFVEKYFDLSTVKGDLPVSESMITLSTCFNNEYRMVIQAVEITSQD
ncbi:MAG: class B sortase [Tissierellia bacterium]|nr:class B sortase [Tissierellia bacterium]